ncbi:tetratricopeptide repeat protein [Fibrobacterota bacterium]
MIMQTGYLFRSLLACIALVAAPLWPPAQAAGATQPGSSLEGLQSDKDISRNFEKLKEAAGKPGASPKIKALCARGYSINKMPGQAARLYAQVAVGDMKALQGNLDAIRVLYAQRNYSLTLKLADNYLLYKPKDMEIRRIQLKCYQASNVGKDKLRDVLGIIVKIEPDTREWWLDLARLDLALGDDASAIKHAKIWVKRNPESLEGYKFLLPLVANNSKEKETHAMVLEKLVELKPGASAGDNLRLGMIKYEKGNYREAEKLLVRAAKSYPRKADVWYKLGTIRSRPEFDGTGREEFRKAYQLEPGKYEYAQAYAEQLTTDEEIKNNLKIFRLVCQKSASFMERKKLAKSYFFNNDFKNSANAWETLIKLDSAILDSEPMAMESFIKAGQYEKLVPVFEVKVKRDSRNIELREKLLNLYKKTNDDEKYLKTLEKVVSLNPGYKKYQRDLAREYKRRGKDKQAQKHFEEWTSRNPEDQKALVSLYELLGKKKNSKDRRRVLESLVETPGVDVEHKREMGLIYYKEGDADKARKLLQGYLGSGKFDEEAAYALYEIYRDRKMEKAARKLLKELHAGDKDNAKYALPLARMEVESKNYSDVVRILGRSNIKPNLNSELSFQLLEAYIQTNKLKAASKYGRVLMQKFPDKARKSISLAALFYKQKRTKEARKLLKRMKKTSQSDAAHFYLGLIAFDEKKWKTAIKHLEKSGNYSDKADFYLGKAYNETKQYDKALDYYQDHYSDKQAVSEMADKAFKNRNYAAAVALYAQVVETQKKNPRVWEKYGAALMEIGRTEEAKEAFEKTVKLDPKGKRTKVNLARIRMEEGDLDGAEELLLDIVDRKKDEHQAYSLLARIAKERKEPGLAQNYLIMALEEDPKNLEYSAELGNMYYMENDLKEAVKVFAPVSSSLSAESRNKYADALFRTEKTEKARREYLAVYKVEPSPEVVSRLMEIYLARNDPEGALKFAEESEFAESPEVKVSIAKAELAQGNISTVHKKIKSLVAKDKTNWEYRYINGLCYFKESNFKKARKEFREALKRNPGFPECIYLLGKCELKMRNAKMAKKFFHELHDNANSEWKVKGLLGTAKAFEQENKLKYARHYIEKVVELEPSVEVFHLMSQVAIDSKKMKEADQWADKALKLGPDDPEAITAKVEVMLADGRTAQAMTYVKKEVNKNPHNCELMLIRVKIFWTKGFTRPVRKISKKVNSLCPELEMPYYYLGKLAHREEDTAEAKRNFKMYLRYGGDEKFLPKGY